MSAAGLLLAGGAAIGAAGTASAVPASTHQSVVTGGSFGGCNGYRGGFNNCRYGYGGYGYGYYPATVAVVPVAVVPVVGVGYTAGFGGFGGLGFGGLGF